MKSPWDDIAVAVIMTATIAIASMAMIWLLASVVCP